MEQWCRDGRDVIRDRGLSLVPLEAEADGYTLDMSGGLRGLLRKPVDISGERPQQYAECEIEYEYIANGAVVDTHGDHPLEVVVGAGQVTQGMDEAIMTSCCGECSSWWLDPAFAFREHGLRTKMGSVPADAPVQLNLKLVRFTNPMSSQQRIDRCRTMKDAANAILASGATSEAVTEYNRCLQCLGKTFIFSSTDDHDPPQKEQESVDRRLRAILQTNIAACFTQLKELSKATMHVERALRADPTYGKAHFRKAIILQQRGEFAEAVTLLQFMSSKNLGDQSEIVERIAQIEKEAAKLNEEQTKMFARMTHAM